MNIALLNGSPKGGVSSSAWFLEKLEELFAEQHDIVRYHVIKKPLVESDFQTLRRMDAIVLAFPLYDDAIPSHLFRTMVDLQRSGPPEKDIRVYAIANGGFFEGRLNHIALDIVKNWCVKAGLHYGQGVGHGAGSLGTLPLGEGPTVNTGHALHTLANNIEARADGANLLFSPNLPRDAWYSSATDHWHELAESNGLTPDDLRRRIAL